MRPEVTGHNYAKRLFRKVFFVVNGNALLKGTIIEKLLDFPKILFFTRLLDTTLMTSRKEI